MPNRTKKELLNLLHKLDMDKIDARMNKIDARMEEAKARLTGMQCSLLAMTAMNQIRFSKGEATAYTEEEIELCLIATMEIVNQITTIYKEYY